MLTSMKAECRLFVSPDWASDEPEWASDEDVKLYRTFVREAELPFLPIKGMYLVFGHEDLLIKNVAWDADKGMLTVALEKKVYDAESETDFFEDVKDLAADGWTAE